MSRIYLHTTSFRSSVLNRGFRVLGFGCRVHRTYNRFLFTPGSIDGLVQYLLPKMMNAVAREMNNYTLHRPHIL